MIVHCITCNKTFTKQSYEVQRTSNMNFCSRKCNHTFRKTSEIIACVHCGQTRSIKLSQKVRSKSGNFFCSRSCAVSYNNKLKRIGRRSKCEMILCSLIEESFPNIHIIPNDKTMLSGVEVDIAIPEINLAIEWNGIVHYRPIYGEAKLQNIQARDATKLKLAAEQNVHLVVIPDLISTDKAVKAAFKELKPIIVELLRQRSGS